MLARPHLVQYQGSKRILADKILSYMPQQFNRLIEPFSGIAALSIAAACQQRSHAFLLNDINEPLILMLKAVIELPQKIIRDYTNIWNDQFKYNAGHVEHFYHVREKFNNGDKQPAYMLYLLARCVKGSVRYGKDKKFNQAPDKRRHGTNPKNMSENIFSISSLLKDKTSFSHTSYQNIFDIAQPGDIVYLDPPYQGVCQAKDQRYISSIDSEEFCKHLKILCEKNIDFIVSYDGQCGPKSYGEDLPSDLQCKKYLITAGKSSQYTLLGKNYKTIEALYISNSLLHKLPKGRFEQPIALMSNL